MPSSGAGPIERSLARAIANRAIHQPSVSPPCEEPTPNITTPDPSTQTKQRRKVHVNTLAQRYKATKWMADHAAANGCKHIVSKCVRQFPEYFPANTKANLEKASRWWKQRESTLNLKALSARRGNLMSETSQGVRRAQFKSVRGRGRKRSPWVTALYEDLRSDFERLRSAGLKFSTSVLREHALLLILDAPNGSPYHRSVMDKGKLISDRVTVRWVQHFMKAKRIVVRRQTGKLMLSKGKEPYIEKSVAFHLGELKRAFDSGLLRDENIENADETHFVLNTDNGRTLGFKGDTHIKYADVVSGGTL